VSISFTATNRRIAEEHLNYLNKSAYSAGLDFRHQWLDKTYFIDLKLAGSHLTGKPEAIVEAQRASARYYQRPDASHVRLDSSRTSLTGHGGSWAIGREGNGHWSFGNGGLWRSPGFEINDIGFLRQADRILNFFWIGYRENSPMGIFRNFRINLNQWHGWNFDGDQMFVGANLNGGLEFINYWGVNLGTNREQDGLSPGLLRGGPMAKFLGGWNTWFNLYSDSRKKLQTRGFISQYKNDDGISTRISGQGGLFYILSDQMNISVDPFYTYRIENLQYIDNLEFNDEDRYVFGKLKQNTFGFIFRINYSPTPDLSIQYFGQPFTSTGKYTNIKQITNPRGKGSERYTMYTDDQLSYNAADEVYYVDENRDGSNDYSFDLPDYNWNEFLSNLVVRWEYKPGSTFFLVWSQNRDYSSVDPTFSVKNNMSDLFSSRPTNVFLMKMNYWLSM